MRMTPFLFAEISRPTAIGPRGFHLRRDEFARVYPGRVLVVITIIGILIAFAAAGGSDGREAARRMECTNHLKQIGLACLTHEHTHGFFPNRRMGAPVVRLPARGFDKKQPGGWMYNILPYMELQALHDVGGNTGMWVASGKTSNTVSAADGIAVGRRVATPIPTTIVPRAGLAIPYLTTRITGFFSQLRTGKRGRTIRRFRWRYELRNWRGTSGHRYSLPATPLPTPAIRVSPTGHA